MITTPKSGFTLIELLVVMVIISIISGIAIITISTNQRKPFETLTQQLTNNLSLAEEEAMLRPATLGLMISDQAFQFYEFKHDINTNKSSWQPISGGPLSQSHPIPKNTQITLKMQGENVTAANQPKIIISTSGDITPFQIFIGKKDQAPYYQITGTETGNIKSETFHAK